MAAAGRDTGGSGRLGLAEPMVPGHADLSRGEPGPPRDSPDLADDDDLQIIGWDHHGAILGQVELLYQVKDILT